MLKALKKPGVEESYLTIIMDYVQKTHSQHYIEGVKTESISSKTRKEIRMSTLTTLIQYNT
jgi:hypothetical protein